MTRVTRARGSGDSGGGVACNDLVLPRSFCNVRLSGGRVTVDWPVSFPSGCHVILLCMCAPREPVLCALCEWTLVSRKADRDGRGEFGTPYFMEHLTPLAEGTGGLGSVVAPSPGHNTTDGFDGASSTQPAAAVFSSTAAAQGLPTEQVARGDAEASQTLAAYFFSRLLIHIQPIADTHPADC